MMMEEYKRRIELFSLYDHTNIEKHLEKMASKGWMIESIGSTFWRYKKINPQKLRFSVVYYPKAVKENYSIEEGVIVSEDRQSFIDLCSASGWNYVLNHDKLHIFATKNETAPPIDTDAEIQIERIHKFAKSEIIYGYVFLALVSLIFSVYGGYRLWKAPVDILTDTEILFCLTPILFFFSVFNLISYLIWYKKAKSAAENGEFTDTKMIIRFEVLFWVPMYVGCGLLGVLTFIRIRYILLILGLIALGVLLYAIFRIIKTKIINSEHKEIVRIRLKRFAAVMLIFAWTGAGIGTYFAIPKPYNKIKVINEFGHSSNEKVYLDEGAPIDISKFTDTTGKTVSREKSIRDLLLIKETEWIIHTVNDGEDDGLYIKYTVTDVRFTPLLGRCKDELIYNNEIFDYKEMNISSPETEGCKFFVDDDTERKYYAFYKDNRIVSFRSGCDITEEQLLDQSVFEGWDFQNVWKMGENGPELR